MKQLLWFLAVLSLTASVASANGPNAGGVLWVHDTGVVVSSDPSVWPAKPAKCSDVDNEMPLSPVGGDAAVSRYWKVYAAFSEGSSPRLKSVGWKAEFPDNHVSPYAYVNVTSGVAPDEDGAGTDFFIGDLGFPLASGGQVGQSFPTGPRTTTVTTLFIFGGFGYNADPNTYPNPTWSTVAKLLPFDDANFGDDRIPANTDQIAGYGTLGFGKAGYTPCPKDTNGVACCSPDGACVMKPKSECVEPSIWHVLFVSTPPAPPAETWVGPWYACEPHSPCKPPTGACCQADGKCYVPVCTPKEKPWDPCIESGISWDNRRTPEQRCSDNGFYQGNFKPCTPNPCPVAAACCNPVTGGCNVRTAAACAASAPAGTWVLHTEFPACLPNNPCPPPPTGACCVGVGTCTVTTAANCASTNTWHADWPACLPNPCPQPIWACCNVLDGTCVDTTMAACVAPLRLWHVNQLCAKFTCPAPAPIGSCCYPDGTCKLLADVLCPASGPGAGDWRAELTSCALDSCPKPKGTCCDPIRGVCLVRSEANCPAPSLWHLGEGVWATCSPNPCPQPPKGVCCSYGQPGVPDMTCKSGIFQVDCPAPNIWNRTDWVTCQPNPCPEPLPTAACCFPTGTCAVTKAAACLAPGVWGLDRGWFICNPNPCPQPPEAACCDQDGACKLIAEFKCVGLLETWYAEQSACDPNPCPTPPPPAGTCCKPDGTCALTLAPRCTADVGIWTQGGLCTPNPCPLPGACCFLDGTCLIRAAVQCVAPDESYQGHATVCVPNPCVQPTGACCSTSGICQLRTRAVCAQILGSYKGDGTACDSIPCVQPRGACCPPNGTCQVTPYVDEQGIVLCDGQWTMFATCSPNPCALPRGACCDLNGTCTVTYARDCDATRWKQAAPCTPGLCPPPGSCCAPAGTCTLTTDDACADTWTLNGVCAPNTCLQPPLGSCCSNVDGHCTVTLETACADTDIWTQSGTCIPNVCPTPPPAPQGACCAPVGTCAVTTQAVCHGTWTGARTCLPDPCPVPHGACCPPNGSCVVSLQVECDGMWTVLATCTPDPCALPRGSCCDLHGICAVTYAGDCSASDGTWTTGHTTCDPNPCPPPQSACCAATGVCTLTTQVACVAPASWHPEWPACSPNACPQPPQGACCAADETCTLTTQAGCASPAVWHGDLPTCEPTSCPPITPTERMSWGRIKNLYR